MSEPSASNVSRRGLFQILGVAGAATAALAETEEHSHPHAAPATGKPQTPKWRVFDAHQQRTAAVLSDLILPADDRSPSASHAGVPEFIDDWLAFRTEQDGHDRLQAEVLGGLVWLDRESNQLFGKDFADSALDQQKQILDRIAWPARAEKADRQWVEFFNTYRDLTISGFFSSKPGVADLPYLGNTVVAEWKGCEPKVWAVIEERLKNGYRGLLNPAAQPSA